MEGYETYNVNERNIKTIKGEIMKIKNTINLGKYTRKNMNMVNFTYDTEKKKVKFNFPVHFNVLDIPLIRNKIKQSILKDSRVASR